MVKIIVEVTVIKLHLGCGKRDFGEEWIHVDGAAFSHVKYHDLWNLPVDDSSVDLIYSSHCLEYFDAASVEDLLEKWIVKLKVGGVLRLAVPDFESIVTAYKKMECGFFRTYRMEDFVGILYGKWLMGDEQIYHKTVYDFDSLSRLLTKKGIIDVRRYDWRKVEHGHIDDHSQAYLPHMDKENGLLMSLNVEGVKK